jgi:ribose 1,5-bisphosphokinase
MAKLVYLMGASGSGKDSLLDALRSNIPPGLLVAHRYITRPATAGAENHVALSAEEFLLRKSRALFALDWQAHQTHYALGIEIDLWMQQGFSVVVNGSRAHLAAAEARYGNDLLAVCLQVSADVLASRLQARGRETAQEIHQRLSRAAHYQQNLPASCHRVDNNGELHATLSELLNLLSFDRGRRRGKKDQHAI